MFHTGGKLQYTVRVDAPNPGVDGDDPPEGRWTEGSSIDGRRPMTDQRQSASTGEQHESSLEEREVRAADPHLSPETNARLTEELRRRSAPSACACRPTASMWPRASTRRH
jgi:hypothetical protein